MRLSRYFEPGVASIRRRLEAAGPATATETTRAVLADLNRLLWASVPTPALKSALEDVRQEVMRLAAVLCAGDADPWIERQHAQAAVDRLVKVLAETEPNELTKVLDAA